MKKIGIVTVHHYHNYGSMLQAFATQYALEKQCNCKAEIIDVCPPGMFYASKEIYDFEHPSDYDFCMKTFRKKNTVKSIVLDFLHHSRIFRTIQWVYNNKNKGKVNYGEFASFRSNYHLSKKTYRTEDLYDHTPQYDGYVVASDQVWNAFITFNNPVYFLTFAYQNTSKMAYASSIVLPEIPQNAQKDFVRGIKNLDYISLREKESAMLVTQMTGRDAKHVLDPTLLLNKQDWETVAAKSSEIGDYVLTYFLQPTDFMYKLAEKVANDLGIKLIHIEPSKQYTKDGITYSGPISVEKWLRLFMDARIVVTNSFHGMAFSTNFNIPFITTLRWKNSKIDMNSRHRSLIDQFHYESQFVKDGEFPTQDKYNFDYSEVNKILEAARKDSIAFLSQISK